MKLWRNSERTDPLSEEVEVNKKVGVGEGRTVTHGAGLLTLFENVHAACGSTGWGGTGHLGDGREK